MPKYGHTAKISIDIGERTVNIIKTNGSGVIKRAGSAELPGNMPDSTSVEYMAILASTIFKAARNAKVKGSGNCVIVVGGPQIITRCFVWPEMPPESLQLNAESEIAHYLPSESGQFTVNYKVLRRTVTESDGNPVAKLEVFVAAISKDTAMTLVSAAKMSGFTPKRIDIRENSREKLVHTPSLWQSGEALPKQSAKAEDTDADEQDKDDLFDPNGSFAILNTSDSIVNMTVFINGVFYASRYFGSHVKVPAAVNTEFDSSASAHDFDDLATEVSSIIDYIQYRERGFKVASVLLFGGENASQELMRSLSEYLEIPVFQPTERLKAIFKLPKRCEISPTCYLDAYGAALASPTDLSADLSLKPPKKKRHIFKRIVLPIFCLVLILGSLLTAGIYFPKQRILELEADDQRLTKELSRYTVPGDVAELQNEITYMTKMVEEAKSFFLPDGASQVLGVMFTALPSDTYITKVAISEGSVELSGTTDSLDKIAEYIMSLRTNRLFRNANAQIVYSYTIKEDSEDGSLLAGDNIVDFDLTLTLTYAEVEK